MGQGACRAQDLSFYLALQLSLTSFVPVSSKRWLIASRGCTRDFHGLTGRISMPSANALAAGVQLGRLLLDRGDIVLIADSQVGLAGLLAQGRMGQGVRVGGVGGVGECGWKGVGLAQLPEWSICLQSRV